MEKDWAVLKENIRHNLPLPLLLSVLLLAVSPLFLGVENLGETDSYKVLEYYVAAVGFLLFPPIFLAEQAQEIRDLISSKYLSTGRIYLLRLLTAAVCALVLVGAYIMLLIAGNCEIRFFTACFGTVSEIVFIGGMGVLAYAAADHIVVGYMVPVVYYMLCVSAGREKLGFFYLFSMSVGKGEDKWILLAAGVLMMAAGIGLRIKRK